MKTIPAPQGNKRKLFAKKQEAARKDVEQAFGVLQAHFAIVRGPARFWDQKDLWYILTSCIIMHNMIVEDEGEDIAHDLQFINMGDPIEVSHRSATPLSQYIASQQAMIDRYVHSQLQNDLIEHIWELHDQM